MAKKGGAPPGWTDKEWQEVQQSWVTDERGPLIWALTLKLQTEKGYVMEWRDRRFLVDILCDMHPWQVVVKCTQVGLSTIEILKAHFVAQVKGYGVIYTLPTHRLLEEFTKTKIDPLIQRNPLLMPTGAYTMGAHTYDKAGYVLFRGTMGESQDISLTADVIIPDEADRSDLGVIEGLESRLMASPFKGQWWFTNPTRPGVGTDVKWQMSDKREWHVTCPHCGEVQTLTYWDNISSERVNDDEERHFFHCRSCRGEFDNEVRRSGKWIPTSKGKWHGYHISQLMAPWISAEEIVEAERTKSKEFFYNYILGLPVIGEGVSVDKSVIMQNVVPEGDPRWKQGKQKFMGVDVGSSLHVVIGNEHGITKLAYLSDDKDCTPEDRASLDSKKSKWGKLVQLIKLESIQTCVIDNGPADKQAKVQAKFPYKVFRCIYDYNDKRKGDWAVDRKEGTINVHRTRVIDSLLDAYGDGERHIYVDANDPWLDGTGKQGMENCLTDHWSSFYVVGADGSDANIVKKDRMGNVIRTWENAGPDHFGHADIYFYLAQTIGKRGDGGGSFSAGDYKGKPTPTDDEDDFPEEKSSRGFYG